LIATINYFQKHQVLGGLAPQLPWAGLRQRGIPSTLVPPLFQRLRLSNWMTRGSSVCPAHQTVSFSSSFLLSLQAVVGPINTPKIHTDTPQRLKRRKCLHIRR